MTKKRFDYRLGFKQSIKDKWNYTFWKCGYKLGDLDYSFKSFIDSLVSKMDCNPLFIKIERREGDAVSEKGD